MDKIWTKCIWIFNFTLQLILSAALNFVTWGCNRQLNSNFVGYPHTWHSNDSRLHFNNPKLTTQVTQGSSIIQVNFPSIQLYSHIFCHLSSQLLAQFSSVIIDPDNETQELKLLFMRHKNYQIGKWQNHFWMLGAPKYLHKTLVLVQFSIKHHQQFILSPFVYFPGV